MGDRTNDGVQGEGNRAADRRYREGVKRFEEQGRVEPAAEEAKEEVSPERPEDRGEG
jgi:hypothetical protein